VRPQHGGFQSVSGGATTIDTVIHGGIETYCPAASAPRSAGTLTYPAALRSLPTSPAGRQPVSGGTTTGTISELAARRLSGLAAYQRHEVLNQGAEIVSSAARPKVRLSATGKQTWLQAAPQAHHGAQRRHDHLCRRTVVDLTISSAATRTPHGNRQRPFGQ